MNIDIDAIRQRADRYKQTGAGSGKTIQAIQLANTDIPALLAEIDRLRAEWDSLVNERVELLAQVADLADKLHKANAEVDSLTKATTAYANENARLRSKLADLEDVGRCDHDAGLDVECRPCLVETYGQREAEVAR